jgi:hypothetical protein
MNRKLSFFLLLFFISIISSSCNFGVDKRVIPNLIIPSSNINSQIQIFAPRDLNSYKFNEPITILIKNSGENPVLFPNDLNICLLNKNHGKWTEVDSIKTFYLGGNKILQPTKNNPIKFGTTMIEPIIEHQETPIKIRIIISGYRFIDGKKTDQMVAAYTDIWLYPQE